MVAARLSEGDLDGAELWLEDANKALDEDARRELAELIAGSRQRQAKSLEAAFAATLKHVPFPVRGIVKKVLIG
jgi:hypothetical protein